MDRNVSEALKVNSIARRFTESSDHGSNRVPKYVRLADALLDVIESGKYRPGSQIPGERDLTESLPLSLGTIQKAMSNLVDQGVLIRRAGKGTFVSGAGQKANDEKVGKQDLVHFRFRTHKNQPLLPVYLHVESIAKIDSAAAGLKLPWADFLNTGKFHVQIERTLKVADHFKGFTRFYLPFERCGSLLERTPEELSGLTLREFLNKSYNMPTLRFEHQLQSEQFAPDVCRKLGLTEGSFGTFWQILGRTYRDAPATYQQVFLPPGHLPIELSEKLE
jgi:GntR family transcriptional regulator